MVALAWRNLWRQRRRSLTTLAAVALVVLFAIFFFSMGGALSTSFFEDLTEQVGHLQVHPEGYREAQSFQDLLMDDAADVRDALVTALPDGVIVGALEVPGLLAGEERSRGLALQAQDWPEELLAPFLEKNLAAGRFIAAGDTESIVLGQGLAEALQVGLGDEVSVYAPGTEGYGAAIYTVVGLLDLDYQAAEVRTAYVSLEAAQELAAPDAVTRFVVHFPELRRADSEKPVRAAATRVKKLLGSGYEVERWDQLDPTLVAILKFINPLLAIFNLIFFVLAGLLVLNTIYLSLIERVREFGLIISLGARGRQVVTMITLESVLLCLTGTVLGLAVGLGTVASLSGGFSIPGFEELYASFGLDPVLYPSITVWQVLFTVMFALLTAVFAALWPATLAAGIRPAEAMRYTA